jgi:hypothetical protein
LTFYKKYDIIFIEKIKREVITDMAKEFIALAKIKFYNEEEEDLPTDNIIITEVESFVDAVARIEAYYADDLYAIVELTLYDGPFLTTDDTSFNLIKEDFTR